MSYMFGVWRQAYTLGVRGFRNTRNIKR